MPAPNLNKLRTDFLSTVKGGRAAYDGGLARFLKASGVTTLADLQALTPKGVQQIVDTLAKAYVPSTVGLTLRIAKRFYRFLRKRELVTGDPFVDLDMPRGQGETPEWNVLPPSAPETFIAAAEDGFERAILAALVYQGWRVSEMCKMTWGQVAQDAKGRWVASFERKHGRVFRQVVHPDVVGAAKTLRGKGYSPSSPFICDRQGQFWDRFRVFNIVRRCARKAFKRRVTPHGVRATYISRIIAERGIEAARQMAGHESLNTTRRYSRWSVVDDLIGGEK